MGLEVDDDAGARFVSELKFTEQVNAGEFIRDAMDSAADDFYASCLDAEIRSSIPKGWHGHPNAKRSCMRDVLQSLRREEHA